MKIYDKVNIKLLIVIVMVILFIIYMINKNKSSFILDNNSLDTNNNYSSSDSTILNAVDTSGSADSNVLDDSENDGVHSLKWTKGRYIRNQRYRGNRDYN